MPLKTLTRFDFYALIRRAGVRIVAQAAQWEHLRELSWEIAQRKAARKHLIAQGRLSPLDPDTSVEDAIDAVAIQVFDDVKAKLADLIRGRWEPVDESTLAPGETGTRSLESFLG